MSRYATGLVKGCLLGCLSFVTFSNSFLTNGVMEIMSHAKEKILFFKPLANLT